MRVEIDQSGKIEDTSRDTILALSNGDSDTVLIKAKTKRQIQEIFRRHGQIRNFVLFTFSTGLSILIQRNLKYGKIRIDKEYFGKEKLIEALVRIMLAKYKKLPDFEFCLIGKSAKAHGVAYHVAVKDNKPNKVISFEEIMKTIKKTEVGKRLKNA